MSLHRFFAEDISAGTAYVRGEEYAHLRRVLRMREGDGVIALDGVGGIWAAVIAELGAEEAMLHLQEALPSTEPRTRVTVYQALPKGDKMDAVLQKCTELGATRFVPLETAHCVARPKDMEKRLLRWRRIVREAAKQACRCVLPVVCALARVAEIAAFGDETLLWLDEEGHVPMREALEGASGGIGIIVGPEGGWDEAERLQLRNIGAKNTWLGPRILRTETAGMAALAALLYAKGDLGG